MEVTPGRVFLHKENLSQIEILENHGKAYTIAPHPKEGNRPYRISAFDFYEKYIPLNKTTIVRGVKTDLDKRRYSLLPPKTLDEVVDVLEFGSKKYASNNWMYVENARTRYYDATLRHINAWWYGEQIDGETGLHHLAHAVCCLLFLMWFDLNKEVEHGADTDTQR